MPRLSRPRPLPAPGAAALLLAACTALTGCGTPSEALTMSIGAADALQLRTWVPQALRQAIEVGPVQGGQATDRWWGSKISSEAMQQALDDTLRSVDLLAVAPGQGARFQLGTRLLKLEQPKVAADLKVTLAIEYLLVETATGKPVYQRTIHTTHTAELGQALLSQPERTRLANEGAVRQSLVTLLRDLMALRIEAPAAP